jgi:hypothetical protein
VNSPPSTRDYAKKEGRIQQISSLSNSSRLLFAATSEYIFCLNEKKEKKVLVQTEILEFCVNSKSPFLIVVTKNQTLINDPSGNTLSIVEQLPGVISCGTHPNLPYFALCTTQGKIKHYTFT